MEKQDGRKLGKTALEERRRIIIRMKENGSSPSEIVAATGCSRQVIYPLWNNWKKSKNKEKAVAVKKCGRPFGYGRTLTKVQERELQKALVNKYPEQLILPCGRGKTGNTAEVRHRNADTDGGGIFEAVEFYPAEAGTVRLRT